MTITFQDDQWHPLTVMDPCFELYGEHVKAFSGGFDPGKPLELSYTIHSMRSYAPEKWPDGSIRMTPRVKQEGTLRLVRPDPRRGRLLVHHTRRWSTWLNEEPAVEQLLEATVNYRLDEVGRLERWNVAYTTTPVPPVKSYRFDALKTLNKKGAWEAGQVSVQGDTDRAPRREKTSHALTSLYTLIERIPLTMPKRLRVDLMDDLTMLRRGVTLRPYEPTRMDVEGREQTLQGYALVGPAMMPMYFWMDDARRVVAVVGRNVAYTLAEAVNR